MFHLCGIYQVMTWFLLHNKLHEVDEVSGLGNGMYKSAMYTHHVHNNPVARALVERELFTYVYLYILTCICICVCAGT